jgi:hypothetical protein
LTGFIINRRRDPAAHPGAGTSRAELSDALDCHAGRALVVRLAGRGNRAITLRTAAGTETVLRKTITSMAASGISLMPDGLEQTMPKEDIANIVAF